MKNNNEQDRKIIIGPNPPKTHDMTNNEYTDTDTVSYSTQEAVSR